MSVATLAPPRSETELVSADDFLQLHGDESGIELVDGVIRRLEMPGLLHGEVCANATSILRDFVKRNKLGRVMSNDSFIRTRSNPDGCRGADVLFISYATLPESVPTPPGSITPPVELVVEVRSPHDTISELTMKATEYLEAGVRIVVVLDPDSESAGVFRGNELPQRFHNGDELTLPDVLPGFAVPVAAFFE